MLVRKMVWVQPQRLRRVLTIEHGRPHAACMTDATAVTGMSPQL